MNIVSRLSEVVKDCPDFPRKGILFKDIMPIFQDPGLVRDTCQSLVNQVLMEFKIRLNNNHAIWETPMIDRES